MTLKSTQVQKKPLKPSSQEWKPEPYQKKGIKFLLEHAVAGLFLDPGMRKTSIVLGAFKILQKEKVARRALIIAPVRPCYLVWPREIKKWTDFNHFKYEILHGKDKDKAILREADLYITNPDSLEWLLNVKKIKTPGKKKALITYDFKKLKAMGVDTLIVDELSLFGNSTSDRYKILATMLEQFSRRWGMTGSPAANGLMKLFGIMYVLDLGRSLGRYITHFRNTFWQSTGYGGYTYKLLPGAEEQIYEKIKPVVFRLDSKDYLKLPKLVENIIKVELPAKARKVYDEIEKDFITELEVSTRSKSKSSTKIITAVNGGAASIKCCQIANGGLFLSQTIDELGRKAVKREWVDLHQEKIDAVKDLINELNGQQVIVVYEFEHDLERLKKALGKDSAIIGGGISIKKCEQVCDAWNRGELSHILGHAHALSLGLNLQDSNACHIIWHSIPWNYEHFDQLIRRLLRSGNKASHVYSHLIVAEDTVDELKVLALAKKSGTQDALFEAVKTYIHNRRSK